jgi:hypothetical protein
MEIKKTVTSALKKVLESWNRVLAAKNDISKVDSNISFIIATFGFFFTILLRIPLYKAAQGVIIAFRWVTQTTQNIPIQLPPNAFQVVQNCMFHILRNEADHIGVNRPSSPSEIEIGQIYRRNVPLVACELIKKNSVQIEEDDLKQVKLLIQSKINSRLRDGNINNIPFASINGRIPIILMVDIEDIGRSLRFVFAWVTNDYMLNFVTQLRMNTETKAPDTSDEDF